MESSMEGVGFKAMRWDCYNIDELAVFLDAEGILRAGNILTNSDLDIEHSKGTLTIREGDWLVRTNKRDFFHVEAALFEGYCGENSTA